MRQVRKAGKRKVGVCVYCGAKGPVSRDHIPPKSLFAQPRPRLITVPSCDACNNGADTDDEYFRMMLTMRSDVGDHPDAKQNLQSIFRALRKPEKQRHRDAFLADLQEVDIVTGAGLYLGKGGTYRVDHERLHRVVERTVKGLFYELRRRRLPDGYAAEAFVLSGFQNMSKDTSDPLRQMIREIGRSKAHVVGNNVLRYWMAPTPSDPCCTAWLLVFYGAVSFVCFTAREMHSGTRRKLRRQTQPKS